MAFSKVTLKQMYRITFRRVALRRMTYIGMTLERITPIRVTFIGGIAFNRMTLITVTLCIMMLR